MMLLLCGLAMGGLSARGGTSALWGQSGENWNPTSRLPDFSHAGYASGERPIPSPPVRGNVRDFGAKGDGKTDDTAAFKKAIAATENGALFVPPGRYVITNVLSIRKSNFVLRGAGPDQSILLFPKSLLDCIGEKPGTGESGNWSWAGGFLWLEGNERRDLRAKVTSPAARGSLRLTVAGTDKLKPGQHVRLILHDKSGRLGRHIHGDHMDAHESLRGRPLVRFPARVARVEGNQVTLNRPTRLDVHPDWRPQLHAYTPSLRESGVEGLGFWFPNRPYPGHYKEVGANAIWMDGGVNCWVRNVRVHNADNAILLERATYCTVDQVRLTADKTRERQSPGGSHQGRHSGHHGLQIRGGDDCLFSRFAIETRFHHDLTVEDATGNVFMQGRGVDICFDHHTHIPYENLFTEIDAGAGTRPWLSNGSRDPESGARETFWNVKFDQPVSALPSKKGPWPDLNLIGVPTTLPAGSGPAGSWLELPSGMVQPSNLYRAQLARRLHKTGP